ncbi:MAG TPA: phosphoribosylanthranilate isomerase [Fimbriimonadaceae bacterium]|nr:phosphoribosylanthranilate isomerase [Fimbriimonadaceae bacterium]
MKVKICGITRPEDAELALDLGADALGFVFEKSSPRYVAPERRFWIKESAPYAQTVAVYGPQVSGDWAGCNSIQCIDPPDVSCPELIPPVLLVVRPRFLDPSVCQMEIGNVLGKNGHFSIRGIVLDAFDDRLFGGTGKPLDWDLAAALRELLPKPVILAGGLTPDNVAEAIRRVRPYAVDVSSGVESSPGIKDSAKLRDFILAAKQA